MRRFADAAACEHRDGVHPNVVPIAKPARRRAPRHIPTISVDISNSENMLRLAIGLNCQEELSEETP
jgi:hypothetical protein